MNGQTPEHSPHERWTPWQPRANGRKLRLYCLPHAGGSASAYLGWMRSPLADTVEICPVELPGHGTRIRERLVTDLPALVARLRAGLFADEPPGGEQPPFAVFGHSMGASIAYELVRQLITDGGPRPVRLIVSGARPPGSPIDRVLHTLTDERLLGWLADLEGTPREALAHPELMRLTLDRLRGDLALTEMWRPPPSAVDCPVTALGGVGDPIAGPEWISRWSAAAAGGFGSHLFPGKHFYLHEAPDEVLAQIIGVLSDVTDTSGATP
ncbi:hypothetical protein BS329_35320 [Amycolatopsis coloradensis]|uniref:Thioesterase domain-containing protein n=1 Tax=Amycolatopsis coloradensis TaxID=76021 RepID=A0A1R0KH58_9PSEU|nr:alpha/beta fold hydrolase [Amycolatopsis coloradensis]OLZ45023.1 hypothetical protein BS329_35320 [Amycolatopsis coloradensis]